ncbi:3,4-dihydroxy-2-butanone-4-phosphate synthase [Puerhibacterium sp. TATVAM-FAB25]|uniref:3,4-dihydroxy-2-butanone-4-phosphate synthase n=1 Tax=Puerhibacterium sp. TATVAM-FAB25 TaxID=3093699 RepID=UPI0039783020
MSAVEQALAALGAGRPVLVADDASRENEVDVVVAAQDVDAATVAWVVRHSSGYLCAPMPAARADALDLPLMVVNNEDSYRTAYTVTVDAAAGVSTGISAADRARTLRVLADPAATPGDLIRPGHVLPLRARPGGVLERTGHTEAAVDLVRLAGRGEVGLIAELVHDDGDMLRLDDARRLAAAEGLVLITVAELVAWRREHDPLAAAGETAAADAGPVDADRVEPVAEAALPTRHGTFRLHAFRDRRTGAEHVALVAAAPRGLAAARAEADAHAPLVRVHSECLTGDALGSLRCDCGPQLDAALGLVAERGGAVVYLGGHEGRGIGLAAKVAAYALQDAGLDTVAANVHLGLPVDAREYGAAAAVLRALGLGRVTLLTNNPDKVQGLRQAGVDVAGTAPLEVGLSAHNHRYLLTKKTAMGHRLALAAPADGRPAPTFEEESA